MPRRNAPKPAKRTKLSGSQRYFRDSQQVVHTSTLAGQQQSDSGNNLPSSSTPCMPVVNERQSNVIPVEDLLTPLAEFAENNEGDIQGISCAGIPEPSLPNPNEQRPSSKVSGSSDVPTFSASSFLTAKSSHFLNLDKPNQPKVSVIPAQKLTTRTLYF